jgi:phospholipase D-like protein
MGCMPALRINPKHAALFTLATVGAVAVVYAVAFGCAFLVLFATPARNNPNAAFFGTFVAVAALGYLPLFALTISTLLAALRNQKLSDTERIVWIAAIILLNWIGALAYILLRPGIGKNEGST